VGFVVDKVALGQVFSLVLRFSPVNFISPVLHYTEKLKKKKIVFFTGLHNKPQGCVASVASAAGPFTTKKSAGDLMAKHVGSSLSYTEVANPYLEVRSCGRVENAFHLPLLPPPRNYKSSRIVKGSNSNSIIIIIIIIIR
jgi:hypothetical protein